jgi:hypothetical protein
MTYNPIVDGKRSAIRGLKSLAPGSKPMGAKARLKEDIEEQDDKTAMNMTNEMYNQWDGKSNIVGIFLAPSKGPESRFDRVWETSRGVPASYMGNNPPSVPCPIIVNTSNDALQGSLPAHVLVSTLAGVQSAGDLGLDTVRLEQDHRANLSMNMLTMAGDMHMGNIRAKVQAWNSKSRILQPTLPKAPAFHGNQNTYKTALDLEHGKFTPTPVVHRKGFPDKATLESIRHTDPGNEGKRMESRRMADPSTLPVTVVTKELAQSKINMPMPAIPLPSVIPIDAPLVPPDMTRDGQDAVYTKALRLGTTAGQDKLFGPAKDPTADAGYSPQITIAMASAGTKPEWKDGEQPYDADDAMGMERPESPFLAPPVTKPSALPTPSAEESKCAPKKKVQIGKIRASGRYRPY